MGYFAVTYTYGPDKAFQDEHRPEHRAFLGDLAAREVVVASGPLVDSRPAQALIVVRAASAAEARQLLADDPFQRLDQVLDVTIAEWNPVIGILS